jgi:hypothetical protein
MELKWKATPTPRITGAVKIYTAVLTLLNTINVEV